MNSKNKKIYLSEEKIELLKSLILNLFPNKITNNFSRVHLKKEQTKKLKRSLEKVKEDFLDLEDSPGITLKFFDSYIEIEKDLVSETTYLSIDLGIKNPVTMVNSRTGECEILGRDYMSRQYYFDREIGKLRNIYIKQGLDSLETKKMNRLLTKKENTLNDILQKITRFLTNYCIENNITTVIVGDIQEKQNNPFPYEKFYQQLKKKLKVNAISILKQNEAYTSQVPPEAESVSKEYAYKENRILRGLFKSGKQFYNADGIGAFNILKSYLEDLGQTISIPVDGIKSPIVVTVSD